MTGAINTAYIAGLLVDIKDRGGPLVLHGTQLKTCVALLRPCLQKHAAGQKVVGCYLHGRAARLQPVAVIVEVVRCEYDVALGHLHGGVELVKHIGFPEGRRTRQQQQKQQKAGNRFAHNVTSFTTLLQRTAELEEPSAVLQGIHDVLL